MKASVAARRNIVFISKATPEDDEFVLWLAPRLEAEGYTVFADILALEPGDRWRKRVTNTLHDEAVKMLLCCRDESLDKEGVQEEIGIGSDLVKELNDPRFIIPLRLKKFKKVFGIGELQYVDFVGSWANGLRELLESLERQGVPQKPDAAINPSWGSYMRRLSLKVESAPEVLTTNWLRVASIPDVIRYYQPPGAIDHAAMERTCTECAAPANVYLRGFFCFATPEEVARDFEAVGKFEVHSEHNVLELMERGSRSPNILPKEARNMVSAMFRRAWENMCASKGLYRYLYSKQLGYHAAEAQVPLGKRIPWGRKGERRSSMLRNRAGGRVWQYGVSASPNGWPFWHFKLKARVVFAEQAGKGMGSVFDDVLRQHSLRRTVCKGWRNKAWHGRLMAFTEMLSEGADFIELPLSPSVSMKLDARPLEVVAPVTTALPNVLSDDQDEQDESTLGNFPAEDEE
jgi:hypothetical protein